MNRKEGIIIGVVMLATFVGGVFAEPSAAQLLNVFVTNFPANQKVTVTNFPGTAQNEVRHVVNVTFTMEDCAIGPCEFASSGAHDVSQFRRVVALFRVTSGPGFGGILEWTGFFKMGFDPHYASQGLVFADLSFMTQPSTVQLEQVAHDIDGADLRAKISFQPNCPCSGTVTAKITLLLQR